MEHRLGNAISEVIKQTPSRILLRHNAGTTRNKNQLQGIIILCYRTTVGGQAALIKWNISAPGDVQVLPESKLFVLS